MATFAELKNIARKLNIPVTIHSFLPKLALNPEATTVEEVTALFEDSARKPTKVQIVLLTKIVEQAAIDHLENKPGSRAPKRKPRETALPSEAEKLEPPKTVDVTPTSVSKDSIEMDPETENPVQDSSDLPSTGPDVQEVASEEEFIPQDYEQVSFGLPKGRSQQTLNINTAGNQTTVSWSNGESDEAVFVLVASNTAMPDVVAGADYTKITKDSQVSISGEYKFFKLFEFSQPKTKGYQIASGVVLGDISEFVIETYPNEVRIRWSSTDDSAAVAIYKSKANSPLPAQLTAEYKLAISRDFTNYTDREVQPGQSFEYCAILESQTVSGKVDITSGMRKTVAIPGDVPKVENFVVTRDSHNDTVHISYSKPKLALAKVKVFQIPGVPSANLKEAIEDERPIPFERLKQQDIEDWLGKEIIESEEAQEDNPTILEMRGVPIRDPEKRGSVTYVAVSTLGSDALISGIQVIHLVGPIGELNLLDRFDYQILRTEVPEGAILLKVYLANPGTDFEVAKKDSPRNVHVATEYRRFGGIIWGDDIPGVAGVNRLPVKPLRIWVQGVAMYDGQAHPGTAKFIDYPGRVEVSYQLDIAGKSESDKASPKNSIFGRKSKESKESRNPKRVVKVKVNAPAETGDLKFTIRTTPKGTFYLEDSSATSSPEKVTLLRSNFKEEREIVLESGQRFVFDSDLHDFRLKSLNPETDRSPRFIIDSIISSRSKTLEQSQIRQQQLSVAILGAKQSGKTTYLQALLNYFDQQFSTKYATQLDAPEGNKVSEARLAELKEFIRSGTLPQATKSATNVEKGSDRDPRKPIQFEFGGNVSPIKGIEIYDLAGEDMDSRESMALYKDVLIKCDLIILLVDPMQDPAMEQTTRGAVAAPPRGTAPFDVLRNLEETLLGSGVQRASQKLAVVVSKFDGVEVAAGMESTPVFGILEKGLSLTRDVNTNSMKLYNERDGISLDREVMALIGKLDAMAAFTRALADSTVFSQKRCFVVSSLGHSTHAPRMDKAGITSFRISDPILWALEG